MFKQAYCYWAVNQRKPAWLSDSAWTFACFLETALRLSLLNLSKSIKKSLSIKNKKPEQNICGLFLADRKGKVFFPFIYFFFLNKTTPSQDNSMSQILNDYLASNHYSLEQPRWQGGDRLQSVVQKELEAKYRAGAFNRLRQLLKTPSHGPNISAAVEAALRRSKIKQSQPFPLQHAVQETQSSEASVLSKAILSPQLKLS